MSFTLGPLMTGGIRLDLTEAPRLLNCLETTVDSPTIT